MKRLLLCCTLLIAVMFSANLIAGSVDTPCANIVLGDSLSEKWDHEGAAKAYLKAIEEDSTNYEAFWKAADEVTEVANDISDKEKDKKEELYAKADALCDKAIAVDPYGWEGHFYKSVAGGRLALFLGGKKKINMSKQIKVEVDRAITLNPEADLAYHVLGRWHQNLANLSWMLRAAAKVIYGGVPPGSNEEAVDAFKKAIAIDPLHIEHHLELGRTYKMMGKKDLAVIPLETVLKLPNTDEDDDAFKKEAEELLKKVK
ncbi:hypothetical protein HQ585_07385 [candidate division KSB1 bacterium]|nr:hypothetical protein [candidate division KSB1 bacterium]